MTELIVTSSVLILVIAALRFCLKGRISARLQYALWGVVALRLLLPFSLFESPVSVMNLLPDQPAVFVRVPVSPSAGTGAVQPEDKPINSAEPATAESDAFDLGRLAVDVWLGGALLCGAVFLVSNLRLSGRLRRSRTAVEDTGCKAAVYAVDGLPSPCLYGCWKPAVYLTPDSLTDTVRLSHILAHEETHYQHKDHIWALVRAVCVCLHWYNPLVWLAAALSRRDSELACDESTLQRLGDDNRIAYGRTLIEMMTAPVTVSDLLCCSTTMSGGKLEIAERLRRIAGKPRMLLVTAVVVALVMGVTAVATFGGAAKTGAEGNATYTERLWSARTEYVGNASAVGKLIDMLPVPQGLSYDHFELHTSEQPYDIEIFYTAEFAEFALYDNAENSASDPFQKNALILLALVDNADGVRATVQCGEKTSNFINMRSWAEGVMGGDVRRFAASPEKLAELVGASSESEISFDHAMGIVKAVYPQPMVIEADGDRTILDGEVGYSFRVSMPMTQGDDTEAVPRLMHIVGVVKSTGELWEYGLDTDKWTRLTSNDAGEAAQQATYSFTQLGKNGEIIAGAALSDQQLGEAIIMNVMVKSAAWEGADITTLEECYLIRQTFPNTGEMQDYYAYLDADGRTVLQSGNRGWCGFLSEELYDALKSSFKATIKNVGDELIEINGKTYHLIFNKEQLRAVGSADGLSKNYLLQADIDISGEEWVPIGSEDKPFTGTFSGNGFTIRGMTIKNPDAKLVGLFGFAENAYIYNVSLKDYDISSAGSNVPNKSVSPVIAVRVGTRIHDFWLNED